VTSTEPSTPQRYLPTVPYRGTRDFLPAEMSVREQVFGTLHRCIERFGYQRYDGPLLESAEIYEAKSGEEIARQELPDSTTQLLGLGVPGSDGSGARPGPASPDPRRGCS
jgi:hypothetical protein